MYIPMPLKDNPTLLAAVKRFLAAQGTDLGSTYLRTQFEEQLDSSETFEVLFQAPILANLFTYEAAVRWLVFLAAVAPQRADTPAADPDGGVFAGAFDAVAGLEFLASVYDEGTNDEVWAHFYEEESDEESSDEDSDDSDEAPVEAPVETTAVGTAVAML